MNHDGREQMEAQEYKVDRSGWPAGEWDNEPDRVEWRDAATGLPCLIVRQRDSGHLCGYVGVTPDHPWHGKNYDDVNVSVHGGLTYSNECAGHICHVPAPGETDEIFWFGFDCTHSGDYTPDRARRAVNDRGGVWARGHYEMYRTVSSVKHECKRLAEQIKAAA